MTGGRLWGKPEPRTSLSMRGLSAVRRTWSRASTSGLTTDVHSARRNRERMPPPPIWINFMQEALKPLPVMAFTIPEGVTFVKVDPATGLLEGEQEGQPGVPSSSLPKGSEPTEATQRRLGPD